MLKSLLFSLFLMLCLTCGSPLTQAAEDVRPEKSAPAESRTSTEDDRYKALLRRLDSIESNLKAKQHIDDALKKFDAQTQGQVSMLSTGFTALGVMTGILALAGLVIAVLTRKMYLQSLRGYRKELKEILDEARKHRKILREMTAEYSPAEKFAAPVLTQAREAAAHGVGTEVLWGKAILTQEEERWQEALTYWQGVLEMFPQDQTALFGASLAAAQLSEKATGEERQRLWETAEKHFKAFPETQLTAAVLGNWGLMCQKRGEAATDSNERERWFNEAEEKYRKATNVNPNHAASWYNWGLLCQNRGEATTDSTERERWFREAAKKYLKATEADPNHANSWGNWGLLCQKRGKAVTDSNKRERWFNKAEEKYRKATEADPNHANNWSNWGSLCMLRGSAANDNRTREDWYNNAEEKYHRAIEADPSHANSRNNWAVLCMSQGKAASDADTREHWYAEADKNLTKALEIAPRYAAAWFNKACLASLRQDVKACVDALTQWRKYESDASTAFLDREPDFDNVRDTPEFQEFCKKLADKK